LFLRFAHTFHLSTQYLIRYNDDDDDDDDHQQTSVAYKHQMHEQVIIKIDKYFADCSWWWQQEKKIFEYLNKSREKHDNTRTRSEFLALDSFLEIQFRVCEIEL
jgi:hypothetical protein